MTAHDLVQHRSHDGPTARPARLRTQQPQRTLDVLRLLPVRDRRSPVRAPAGALVLAPRVAPMLPSEPVQRPLHGGHTLVKVHRLTHQPETFALPHAGEQPERPARPVWIIGYRLE